MIDREIIRRASETPTSLNLIRDKIILRVEKKRKLDIIYTWTTMTIGEFSGGFFSIT